MRRIAAAAVLVSLLGACSGNSWTLKAHAPVTQAVLRATMHTTGALTTAATYTSGTGPVGAPTCLQAATRGNSALHQFVIGAPGTFGAPVYFGMRTVAYRGPGTYRQSELRLDSISTVIRPATVLFRPGPASATTMTVNADGSGHAAFTSYVSNDGRTLSGTIGWTCRTQGAL